MKKIVYLLNIDNFAPEVTRLTYPFIRLYAERIGAGIVEMRERKFPDWPVTYEKLQIFDLAKKIGSDWNIYIDSDTLIHPQCPDYTVYLPKDTVAFHGVDPSILRFREDEYFLRDGRFISPGNWFAVASNLCLDLWHPLDISLTEALKNIHVTPVELKAGITPEHLIDDYTLARNMARYGLKCTVLTEVNERRKLLDPFVHRYRFSHEENATFYREVITKWECEQYLEQ